MFKAKAVFDFDLSDELMLVRPNPLIRLFYSELIIERVEENAYQLPWVFYRFSNWALQGHEYAKKEDRIDSEAIAGPIPRPSTMLCIWTVFKVERIPEFLGDLKICVFLERLNIALDIWDYWNENVRILHKFHDTYWNVLSTNPS